MMGRRKGGQGHSLACRRCPRVFRAEHLIHVRSRYCAVFDHDSLRRKLITLKAPTKGGAVNYGVQSLSALEVCFSQVARGSLCA
jgi:hypothetical protein